MGNFLVFVLCDVCWEVYMMYNMVIDFVDYIYYMCVYIICEDVSVRVWLLYI